MGQTTLIAPVQPSGAPGAQREGSSTAAVMSENSITDASRARRYPPPGPRTLLISGACRNFLTTAQNRTAKLPVFSHYPTARLAALHRI